MERTHKVQSVTCLLGDLQRAKLIKDSVDGLPGSSPFLVGEHKPPLLPPFSFSLAPDNASQDLDVFAHIPLMCLPIVRKCFKQELF